MLKRLYDIFLLIYDKASNIVDTLSSTMSEMLKEYPTALGILERLGVADYSVITLVFGSGFAIFLIALIVKWTFDIIF